MNSKKLFLMSISMMIAVFFLNYYICFLARDSIFATIIISVILTVFFIPLLLFCYKTYISNSYIVVIAHILVLFCYCFCAFRWQYYVDVENAKHKVDNTLNFSPSLINLNINETYNGFTIHTFFNKTDEVFGGNITVQRDGLLWVEKSENANYVYAILNLNSRKITNYIFPNSTIFVATNIYNEYQGAKDIEKMVHEFSIFYQVFFPLYFIASTMFYTEQSPSFISQAL